jgi:transcriptional regulator with XRE-family HTH domain
MIRKAILEIKNKYNLSYREILLKSGLPLVDRGALNDFILGKRSYPVEKLEKIFVSFGVEIVVK